MKFCDKCFIPSICAQKRRCNKESECNKSTHGGKRPGAGAKKKPVKAVSRSVSMHPDDWAELDADRGKLSRGAWILGLMKFYKSKRK